VFRRLTTPQLVTDVVVAVAFFVLMLPWTLAPGGNVFPGGWTFDGLQALLVAVILCGALAIRRLSPAGALAVAWVGAVLQMALGLPPLPVDAAVFGVLYTAAAYGTRSTRWLGLASAFVGAGAVSAYIILPPLVRSGGAYADALRTFLVSGVTLYVAAAFAFLLAWAVGALVRTTRVARENRDAQRRAEAETAAEAERARIARDMHDVVAHSLAVVIAQADGARYAAASAAPSTSVAASTGGAVAGAPSGTDTGDPQLEALATISSTARAALADVRILLAQLRHRQEDGPQPTIADLDVMFTQMRAAGLDLRIDVDPAPRVDPPTAVQLAVYRILQEALTNALRHGTGLVDVSLAWYPESVDVSVRNAAPVVRGSRPPRAPLPSSPATTSDRDGTASPETGTGTEPVPGLGDPAAHPPRGHGLIGMRERALLAGGVLDAGIEGDAFVVRARIPLGGAV